MSKTHRCCHEAWWHKLCSYAVVTCHENHDYQRDKQWNQNVESLYCNICPLVVNHMSYSWERHCSRLRLKLTVRLFVDVMANRCKSNSKLQSKQIQPIHTRPVNWQKAIKRYADGRDLSPTHLTLWRRHLLNLIRPDIDSSFLSHIQQKLHRGKRVRTVWWNKSRLLSWWAQELWETSFSCTT